MSAGERADESPIERALQRFRKLTRVFAFIWQADCQGLCMCCEEPTEGFLKDGRGSKLPLCSACWSAVAQEPP